MQWNEVVQTLFSGLRSIYRYAHDFHDDREYWSTYPLLSKLMLTVEGFRLYSVFKNEDIDNYFCLFAMLS